MFVYQAILALNLKPFCYEIPENESKGSSKEDPWSERDYKEGRKISNNNFVVDKILRHIGYRFRLWYVVRGYNYRMVVDTTKWTYEILQELSTPIGADFESTKTKFRYWSFVIGRYANLYVSSVRLLDFVEFG